MTIELILHCSEIPLALRRQARSAANLNKRSAQEKSDAGSGTDSTEDAILCLVLLEHHLHTLEAASAAGGLFYG